MPRAAKKRAASPKQALMHIAAPPKQPWALTVDEVGLVKNHIAKGATDEELKFCLAVARRFKLDPFRQQIWFVQRNDKSAQGGKRWIPVTGINGLLHIAARDHKDFGSNDEPEFGPMKEVKWAYYDKKGIIQAPEWAKVTLWKKGHEHPIVATVYWDEIYPDIGAAPLVKQMPRLMLGKCALAQALRRAYPATDGLYIKEEFQGPPEFTPGGRVYTVEQPQISDAERNYEAREDEALSKLNPAQREIVEKKIAESAAKGPQVIYSKWFSESETFRLTGPREMLLAHKEGVIKPYWNKDEKQFILNTEQFASLGFELEKSGIALKAGE